MALPLTRRSFLKFGVAGALALSLAPWVEGRAGARKRAALDDEDRALVRALAPALLAGALPADEPSRTAALDEILAALEQTLGGLPSAVRAELDALFALLLFAPARRWLCGVSEPWMRAAPQQVEAFLNSWQHGRFALQRQGYQALARLIQACWYGNPRAWTAIGYAGPPMLSAGTK
ncbi:MAG TPA: hypothetical protein VFV17_01580 [Usitatibacteraceae bacterium]|nr:hypothetical protein [Usitatibacteraceae bacterium]